MVNSELDQEEMQKELSQDKSGDNPFWNDSVRSDPLESTTVTLENNNDQEALNCTSY